MAKSIRSKVKRKARAEFRRTIGTVSQPIAILLLDAFFSTRKAQTNHSQNSFPSFLFFFSGSVQ
jgi:hypothetical protein